MQLDVTSEMCCSHLPSVAADCLFDELIDHACDLGIGSSLCERGVSAKVPYSSFAEAQCALLSEPTHMEDEDEDEDQENEKGR